ncbi:hypothetical protein B296_00031717 [Ensete ventricosum]|uniref:Retrotransposon gag domain-containing protein n=1 Tax=Ensete ventricosum TaxID=4639 RepID=A0A426XTG2_ENSVE|nr:hypothetical protein B296_00031717 [Ensete ventricosum]
MWYNRMKSHLISFFDQMAKEFESNFLASAKLKLSTIVLLRQSQKDEEPLSYFVSRFVIEIMVLLVPDRVTPDNRPKDAPTCQPIHVCRSTSVGMRKDHKRLHVEKS